MKMYYVERFFLCAQLARSGRERPRLKTSEFYTDSSMISTIPTHDHQLDGIWLNLNICLKRHLDKTAFG